VGFPLARGSVLNLLNPSSSGCIMTKSAFLPLADIFYAATVQFTLLLFLKRKIAMRKI
jgi:hypothetical protein